MTTKMEGKADAFIRFVLQKTHEYFANAFPNQEINLSIDPEVFERGWRVAIAALPKTNPCFTQAFCQHLFTKLSDTTSALFQEDTSAESQTVFKEWVLREYAVVHEPNSPAVKEHLVALFSCDQARALLGQLEQDNNNTRAILALYSLGGIFSDTNLIQFFISNCSDCTPGAMPMLVEMEEGAEGDCGEDEEEEEDIDDDDEDEASPNAPVRTYAAAVSFFSDIVPSSALDKKEVNRVLNMNLDEARTLRRLLKIASKGATTQQRLAWLHLTAQKHMVRCLKNSLQAFKLRGGQLEFIEKSLEYVEAFGKDTQSSSPSSSPSSSTKSTIAVDVTLGLA